MEIHRLHEMLTEAGISHEWRNRAQTPDGKMLFSPPDGMEWGYQVIVYKENGNRLISAIEGYGTYGYMNWMEYNRPGDSIEIMGLLTHEEEKMDSVVGGLSAEEVFERIRNALKNNM